MSDDRSDDLALAHPEILGSTELARVNSERPLSIFIPWDQEPPVAANSGTGLNAGGDDSAGRASQLPFPTQSANTFVSPTPEGPKWSPPPRPTEPDPSKGELPRWAPPLPEFSGSSPAMPPKWAQPPRPVDHMGSGVSPTPHQRADLSESAFVPLRGTSPQWPPNDASTMPKDDPDWHSNYPPHLRPPPKRLPNGQFAKGHSGNYFGRPKVPERSRTTRQLRRDLFAEAERTLVIDGEKGTPFKFIIRRLLRKAAEGDSVSIKFALQLYSSALAQNEAANRELIDGLEFIERMAAKEGNERTDKALNKALNDGRKRSRRT